MKFLFLIIVISSIGFTKDGGSIKPTGTYRIVATEACASFGLLVNCKPVKPTDFEEPMVQIVQSGEKESIRICLTRNFNDGLFNKKESCYFNASGSGTTLSLTSAGFKGEYVQDEFRTYSQFRRKGIGYFLRDGGESIGINVYYNYDLEKVN